jgi:hypothetical protein
MAMNRDYVFGEVGKNWEWLLGLGIIFITGSDESI